MAKTNDKSATPGKPEGPSKLLVLAVVSVISIAAGALVPNFLFGKNKAGAEESQQEAKKTKENFPVYIPFGQVIVNLRTPQQTRLLNVKIALVVDKTDEKETSDRVAKMKTTLKNEAISYLVDRTPEEVRGAVGMNRVRRELWHRFKDVLYPDGEDKVKDLLFEEFQVQ